jgi:glucose/arabinose dehydrogenase
VIRVRYCALAASLSLLAAYASHSAAQERVDERPLDIQVVEAFPRLEWPDELTGRDQGLATDVRPLVITGAGDASNRLFVANQTGVVMAFDNDPNVEQMATFLDIRDRIHYRVPQENEEGLLGLAFHPKFKENGELFVYYTGAYEDEKDRKSVISRFRVSKDDPNRVDPATEEVIMTIGQPFWNHNGGTIIFGPDGYLYIGLGDGGKRADPFDNAQNLSTLLGSILRIDVDRRDEGLAYAIPPDNPFVGRDDARGEIWAYGLRNVWRMAFDPPTGLLWAADVGQDIWEEIDIIEKGGNYGWNLREGMHDFEPSGAPPAVEMTDLIEPLWEYHHDVGKSITGGNVYRGPSMAELEGAYLYADFVSGRIWALWYDQETKRVTANRAIRETGPAVMTFGEDDDGETYFATQEGGLWKFARP